MPSCLSRHGQCCTGEHAATSLNDGDAAAEGSAAVLRGDAAEANSSQLEGKCNLALGYYKIVLVYRCLISTIHYGPGVSVDMAHCHTGACGTSGRGDGVAGGGGAAAVLGGDAAAASSSQPTGERIWHWAVQTVWLVCFFTTS